MKENTEAGFGGFKKNYANTYHIIKDNIKEIILILVSPMLAKMIIPGTENWSIEAICAIILNTVIIILGLIVNNKYYKWSFLNKTRFTKILAVLLVMGAIVLIIAAHYKSVSTPNIALIAGLIALNAGAIWLVPSIPADKILLKSIMTAVPAANLIVAISFGVPVLVEEFQNVPPVSIEGFNIKSANLTVVNNCIRPIEYSGSLSAKIDIKPFSTETIPIPKLFFTVERDESKITVKGITHPLIYVERKTVIIFDNKRIEPGSKMIINIAPGSSHKLIINCG